MDAEKQLIPTHNLSAAALDIYQKSIRGIRTPYKYDDEYHPNIFIYHALHGTSITSTCAKIGIARCTYYQWISDHETFSKAAKVASTIRQAFFDDVLKRNLNERDFNFLAFESNYRRLFHYSDQAKVELDSRYADATNAERVELVQKALAEQKLDPVQASTIISSIKAASDVAELEDVKNKLEELKTKLEA